MKSYDSRKYTRQLTDDDYQWLADHYDIEDDVIRRFDDDEWCGFIGCQSSELGFYLLNDDEGDIPDPEEDFDQTPRSAWDIEDEEGDIGAYIERLNQSIDARRFDGVDTSPRYPVLTGSTSTGRYSNTHYGSHFGGYHGGWPSTKHLRPDQIPHFFEVVK